MTMLWMKKIHKYLYRVHYSHISIMSGWFIELFHCRIHHKLATKPCILYCSFNKIRDSKNMMILLLPAISINSSLTPSVSWVLRVPFVCVGREGGNCPRGWLVHSGKQWLLWPRWASWSHDSKKFSARFARIILVILIFGAEVHRLN